MVKFTQEYKHAIPGQIYKGILACNTWVQYFKFAKEYKHAIPGQIY